MRRARRRLHGLWELVASYALTHPLVSPGSFRLAAPLYVGAPTGVPAEPSAEARLA